MKDQEIWNGPNLNKLNDNFSILDSSTHFITRNHNSRHRSGNLLQYSLHHYRPPPSPNTLNGCHAPLRGYFKEFLLLELSLALIQCTQSQPLGDSTSASFIIIFTILRALSFSFILALSVLQALSLCLSDVLSLSLSLSISLSISLSLSLSLSLSPSFYLSVSLPFTPSLFVSVLFFLWLCLSPSISLSFFSSASRLFFLFVSPSVSLSSILSLCLTLCPPISLSLSPILPPFCSSLPRTFSLHM